MDVIGTKEFSSLPFTVSSILTDLPPPPHPPPSKSDLKLVCMQTLYTEPENSQDYALKPQRNCTFMNSAPVQLVNSKTIKIVKQYHYSILTIGSYRHTVIRFVSTSAKFGICIVVGLNGTLVGDKMRRVLPRSNGFQSDSITYVHWYMSSTT